MSDKPVRPSDTLNGISDRKAQVDTYRQQVEEPTTPVDTAQNPLRQGTVEDKATVLHVVLAEYVRKEHEFQFSLDTANQSFNQYLTAMAFLVPGISAAALFWSKQEGSRTLTSLVMMGIAIAIVLITHFTITRMRHAVMEQREAIKSLKNIHEHLVNNYQCISHILAEPKLQPWLNPFTLSQGLALSILAGFFAGLVLYAISLAVAQNPPPLLSIPTILAIVLGLAVAIVGSAKIISENQRHKAP